MKAVALRYSLSFAIVDNEDFNRVLDVTWCINNINDRYFTVRGWYRSKTIPLANFIMNDFDRTYDHKDGNPLNNCKDNLRVCTRSQNNANMRKYDTFKGTTSEYKGVVKRGTRFVAQLRKDGKNHYLGSFTTEIEAAKAYDAGAIKYHGEFARLNFPNDIAH